ncbi:MAG: SDR family oxidoreductase [Clostridium sp.]|jgi:NAD(P)-dependent dehydrogenase (short-subunit alcohol dehydrogenase family)|uniref:SDR family oxidoreductase n=1 Tax=Clostridium sp. TaxID=1506 RepID=UPI0025C490C8|nr:SDR family oxidoreductase [Clostridium sp.]MCH3964895.1 SDR family oxidoreductase [Clostridium sp.]MCI1716610.1 SDR family oxidoreductase [Clostridium sp.]MCI1800908.1 SDR family oxidoreductase [Clostridium sp.]MCI1814787.1 SDR family oxidoreductase [Clostridium sp.]MCI1871655.1 SDR family oxidoreductase [Clostridium sp.]
MNDNFYLNFPQSVPQQKQDRQPGTESQLNPRPVFEDHGYTGSEKLKDKTILITGGDSGIGRAAATAFAKEGADLAIVYYNEDGDAADTKNIIEQNGRKCILIPGDVSDDNFCKSAVQKSIDTFGKIDVLVNNAGVQYPQNSIEDITNEQLEKTFRTNIFSMFYLTRAVLPHFKPGCSIINTASITAYSGNETLIDYSSTKGAIVSFTRSLALSLAGRKIRVNSVAPGPVWTPLIPSSYSIQKVGEFGSNNPMGRPAQPVELASTYVFLASPEASYITGEIIHVNGGQFVTG